MTVSAGKIILDLCGGSGAWSKPYRDAGYDVKIIDIKTGYDVRLLKRMENVYGILAAPVCTVFAGSGAKFRDLRAISEVIEGLSVVDACLRIVYACNPFFWALENPVGWLNDYIGEPVMYFNPCDFGDPYTKKTCLWGKFNLPRLNPVEPTEGSKMHVRYGGRSGKTKSMRSITPTGFAKAFFEANK